MISRLPAPVPENAHATPRTCKVPYLQLPWMKKQREKTAHNCSATIQERGTARHWPEWPPCARSRKARKKKKKEKEIKATPESRDKQGRAGGRQAHPTPCRPLQSPMKLVQGTFRVPVLSTSATWTCILHPPPVRPLAPAPLRFRTSCSFYRVSLIRRLPLDFFSFFFFFFFLLVRLVAFHLSSFQPGLVCLQDIQESSAPSDLLASPRLSLSSAPTPGGLRSCPACSSTH